MRPQPRTSPPPIPPAADAAAGGRAGDTQRIAWPAVLGMLLLAAGNQAQAQSAPPAWYAYSQDAAAGPPGPVAGMMASAAPANEELDRLLAPVALYPDAVLAQLFVAAAFPEQIAQAALWVRQNPGWNGRGAVEAAQGQPWDPAVKALLATPQLVLLMDEHREWTRRLGELVAEREPQVLDTLQALRRRAQAGGQLPRELEVSSLGGNLLIGATDPAWVQLPWYDPLAVYGPWWWTTPPVRFAVWPGAVRLALSPAFVATTPVTLAYSLPHARFDWQRRRLNLIRVHYVGGQPGYLSQNHWRPPPPVSTAWPGPPAANPPAYTPPQVHSQPPVLALPAPGSTQIHAGHLHGARPAYPVTSSAYAGQPVSSVYARPMIVAPTGGTLRPTPPLVTALATPLVPSLSSPVVPTLSAPVVRAPVAPVTAPSPIAAAAHSGHAVARGPAGPAPSGGARRGLMR